MFNVQDLDRLHKLEMLNKKDYGKDGFRQFVLDEIEKEELKARISGRPPIGQKKVAETIFVATSLWKNYWRFE